MTALHLDRDQSRGGLRDKIHLHATGGASGGQSRITVRCAPRRQVLVDQFFAGGTTYRSMAAAS